MASGIYIGMTGATARARVVDAVADNLANADTPGFKSSRVGFEAVLVGQDRESTATPDKTFAAPVVENVDMRQGVIENTGRPLDVVPGDGLFLGVQGDDGQPAFTRNGALNVDAQGTLRSGSHAVLSKRGGAITLPLGAVVNIADDGRVMADGRAIDQLGLFSLDGGVRTGGTLIIPHEGKEATQRDGRVVTGALERSNRPAVESAVELMRAQRSFAHSMQVIDTYHRLDGRAVEIGRRS